MLASTLLASISQRTSTSTTHSKDASIFELSFQPPSAIPRSVLKKSSTPPRALAASSTHIFAAQADKAALHIYARDSGLQQTLVPLRERATALTCARDGALVVLGTEGGSLVLWETHTGRVVRTPEAHLGAVTAVRVDPAEGCILSAGEDGAVLVWSVAALLAFGDAGQEWSEWRRAPVRSLRAHRDAVEDVVVGHGKGVRNIAVSAGKDGTVVVWDYHEGLQLRTILLPEAPTCLALDPCDRAVLCGFEDGSVVAVDFMGMDGEQSGDITSPIWDERRQALVVQIGAEAKWKPPAEDIGSTLCAAISYDSTKLLTGHQSGNVIIWDIPTGRFGSQLTATPLPGPVSNLTMLEVTGFANTQHSKVRIKEVVKPRFGELDTNEGLVPDNYKITARLVGDLPFQHLSAAQAQPVDTMSDVERALCHPSFPPDLLAESLADMQGSRSNVTNAQPVETSTARDFMALDGDTPADKEMALQKENEELKRQVEALKRLQKESFAQLEKLSGENAALAKAKQGDQLEAERAELEKAERSWDVGNGKKKSKR
ncbi:WD40 repeat-like protein [Myriangium duriaei CBS 260.36]|uniref:Pre-rRNA-processing protein IPI3 n=1 Tax=Myriangium duriaei CBS 260.36 TaxID=1168546 RepID=A0A9P4MGD6_9PEZI|nr:WD40 repeat-like protein [Myriangium duriaei CBS 260.36]